MKRKIFAGMIILITIAAVFGIVFFVKQAERKDGGMEKPEQESTENKQRENSETQQKMETQKTEEEEEDTQKEENPEVNQTENGEKNPEEKNLQEERPEKENSEETDPEEVLPVPWDYIEEDMSCIEIENREVLSEKILQESLSAEQAEKFEEELLAFLKEKEEFRRILSIQTETFSMTEEGISFWISFSTKRLDGKEIRCELTADGGWKFTLEAR